MKKSGLLTVIFAGLLLLFIPVVNAATTTSFSDVNDSFWAAEEIEHFANYEVINGYGDGTFLPNKQVTRAEGAIILARGLELDTENVDAINYQDFDQKHFAYNEVAAVTNAGIMQGDNGKFNPNKPLTRAEMVTMLVNAFELEGGKASSFKDVSKNDWFYEAVDAAATNQLTTGYEDQTFKPAAATKRAEFVVFLSRALNSSTTDLLKEVYANELDIDTYEFEGSMNLGLTFPEEFFTSPEDAVFAEMFKDIQIDVTGAYQKDPMLMEATVNLTLKGEMGTEISLPLVMTEDKMWFKFPETPLVPVPEELEGKFIEFDLAELAELSEQPGTAMDIELQTEFGNAVTQLFLDHFGNDFYKVVPTNAVDVPSNIDAKTVVQFELNDRTLKHFIKTLFDGFALDFFELLENPEYAAAIGIPAEELAQAKQGLAAFSLMLDDVMVDIDKAVDINDFKELIYITEDNYIAYDKFDLDLTVNVEDQAFGFTLFFDQGKSKVNEEITFIYGIPAETDVITMDELMEIEEEMLGTEETTEIPFEENLVEPEETTVTTEE